MQADSSPRWGVLALIGVVAGVASGLLGVGGGIVIVPLLTAIVGMSQHSAHATSLAAIVPIAALGALTYAVADSVSYWVGALLAVGTLLGAPIGARIMARSTEGALKAMFGGLMVLVALQLLWP